MNKKLIVISSILLTVSVLLLGFYFIRTKVYLSTCGLDILRSDINAFKNLMVSNGSIYVTEGLFSSDSQISMIVFPKSATPDSNVFFQIIDSDICISQFKSGAWEEVKTDQLKVMFRDGKANIVANDINGDGLNEVLILNDVGYAGLNTSYHGYILHDTEVSRVDGLEMVWSPRFDKATNRLISSMKSGLDWITEYYQWQGTKVVKLSQ